MFSNTPAFSGFAVDDLDSARSFYRDTLGLEVNGRGDGHPHAPPGGRPPHDDLPEAGPQPATYTILNFQVGDVAAAVDELSSRGVEFERYDGFDQDDKGIARLAAGPIAWFKDPAGNILSVLSARAFPS